MKYRAYAGGKEIQNFYSGGKEIEEIWGGDTLLWRKEEKAPEGEIFRIYSRFTGYDTQKNPYVCEYSISLMSQTEDGKYKITDLDKIGFVLQNSSTANPPWHSYFVSGYLLFKATFNTNYPRVAKIFKTCMKQWDKNGELVYEDEEYLYTGVGTGEYDGYYSFISGFSGGEICTFSIEVFRWPNIDGSSGSYSKDVYLEGGINSFSSLEEMKKYVMS